jgi:hypothetical protein
MKDPALPVDDDIQRPDATGRNNDRMIPCVT